MANRKLPFGYCMQNGQICVADAEAEIVRIIFTSYAEGNSYETLAEWLNDGRHIYFPGKQWNKNTLARILQDERYLGNSVYPAILTADAFQRRKPASSGKLIHPQIKDIRILAHCGVCGKPIQRERTDTWRCPHCMASAVDSTDRRLMDRVTELLQGLCQHPDAAAELPAADVESEAFSPQGAALLKNWRMRSSMNLPPGQKQSRWQPPDLTPSALRTMKPCGYNTYWPRRSRTVDWTPRCSVKLPPPS